MMDRSEDTHHIYIYIPNMQEKKICDPQVKSALKEFIGHSKITFNFVIHGNGEWTAQCNEIPGIITGGLMGRDDPDILMREAICVAAGLHSDHAHCIKPVFSLSDYEEGLEKTGGHVLSTFQREVRV